ncbi:LOW QUALITY PROTEIN: zinc finger protein 106 [Gymnodraco acuticeps]|uniref:LOW QUALITY PROTEIN: zinc finger protein 106 n=1 Tax=Gymnodraco acuticeps TaxID=8218 RepID=A0A6P8UVM6_GYMAC|nr:LOW QUALITY PROTEIN: zinc finger protein 106 [Gymnodraco acuticeps]
MARDRKCILCETVHVSKQEMDEHMRSMLHHRELEKLKGRDCGHECRVCKVTVASLTDYAGHISSPKHKQNVEAAELKHAGNDRDEVYFDRAFVDLIEKRKEQIRKEKEATSAKLAKEEADRRRKEEIRLKLKETKEHYRLEIVRKQQQQQQQQQQAQASRGSIHNRTWYRGNHFEGEAPPWQHSQQPGRSATWHAQEPPNLQKWASAEFTGGSLHNQGSRQWEQNGFSQQSRHPWLSSGGSSNGIYGKNNIAQCPPQRSRPLSFLGPAPMFPPPPILFSRPLNQFQSKVNDQQAEVVQNGEVKTPEPDHSSGKSSKTCGSNPKLDKACRWTPYPCTKGFEPVPLKETTPTATEKPPTEKPPKPQKQEKPQEALSRQSRPEEKQSVEDKGKHKTIPKTKPRDRSSSGSRSSSSTQRDAKQDATSGASNQKASKPSLQKDRKTTSVPGPAQLASKQLKAQSKSARLSSQAPAVGPLQSRQERQIPEALKKARQSVLEKKSSLERNNRMEMKLHIVEDQSQIGVNKENRQNAAKPNLPDLVRAEKPASQSPDGGQFLQSLQVSTSTLESSDLAALNQENTEKEASAAASDEAMQAAEFGQSSESDASRSGDAQTAPGLSKLDLPPVLKRDLTKHISTKSKPGAHEPNLNIARRVRNLSESRRSDSEKDSGLKPTVRQLISSSGSRRNVNWEQVYQEVRKKQDKGKGMPRFGIEMVPMEQEDQSQEEGDIPLIEGFQWESLMDAPASRKRSLSESSVAPASAHSLFTPFIKKEAPEQRQAEFTSPNPASAKGNKEEEKQQVEVEQMLGQSEEKALEKLSSATVRALQRSDSVLGDSSSMEELYDGQGTGKRRRAAGDVPSAETSCLEHNSKRRKVKSKKERLQIDQLLTVSLREEELSRSLQTVDSSLIQARAALEAAYLEVQRLMVVKQQMSGEMSTLRNKRIELLKGMQGSLEEAPVVKLKDERLDSVVAYPQMLPSSLPSSPSPDPPAPPPPSPPSPPPPSSSLTFTPLIIKQEPKSPIHVSSETDHVENKTSFAHSTTPELRAPPPPAAQSPDPTPNFQPSPERYSTNTDQKWEVFNDPADSKESLSELVETMERATQASRSCLDSKASIKLLSVSRRSSEVGSVADSAASSHYFEPPSAVHLPTSPPESRSGKRVRKLKKRKVLKKAGGTEQAESSDTELDGETMKPRWLRPRRRTSGGSPVSTSTPPSEERDVKKEDPETHKYKVEIPPAEEEEEMEVTEACLQPHIACNEVTSTSDMDVCRSSESDMPFPILSPKMSMIFSDASSDHGEDDLPSEGAFEGHQEAVNAVQIYDGLLYTCSGDRTVRAFNLRSRKCVGVFEGHSSKVSCLLVSAAPSLHHRLYSGSSDQTICCYNLKTRELEQQFPLSDRVLCLHSRWKTLYAGLANGTVVTFNLKTNKQMDVFECHGPRGVSCMASSQEGARRILLVGSYDNTISVRDAKSGLLLRTLEGHTKTVLCMKVVNDLVFSGSSDQCVYAHNIHTGELVRVYKGHSHAVTVVSVLGKVMVTACLDKLVRVYDLLSHEQLQVYGGHKDMVMCMTIHKNMIYTGCYDGSVQAVKLNLMQNYRCGWHGCSLVFGLMEHLQQHLISDHSSSSSQSLKCRWKKCDEFFCTRNSSKQVLQLHMQKHAEEETEVEP